MTLMAWYCYIAANYTNSVLYTGVTRDLEKRIYQHKKAVLKKAFTNRYRVYKVVWFQDFPTPESAIEAEKGVKGWKRYKKINLICERNPKFRDLLSS